MVIYCMIERLGVAKNYLMYNRIGNVFFSPSPTFFLDGEAGFLNPSKIRSGVSCRAVYIIICHQELSRFRLIDI